MSCALLADSGNCHIDNNSFDLQRRLIPAIDTVAASLFPQSAVWLPSIRFVAGASLIEKKPHISLKLLKQFFG
jgi:hypothetical protein